MKYFDKNNNEITKEEYKHLIFKSGVKSIKADTIIKWIDKDDNIVCYKEIGG